MVLAEQATYQKSHLTPQNRDKELLAISTNKRAIIKVNNLSKTFHSSAGPVLDNINLSVETGSIHGIIGRSGAGKSTLVRCLNGLVRPSSGSVYISDEEISALKGKKLRRARQHIAMVFQHFSLLSSRTASANIALPLEIAGFPRDEIRKRVPELLELVGLSEKANAYPADLSGGQKQRIGIARALAHKPSVLLSDEATSALDPETTEQILGLLKDINRITGVSIVLITHEMDVVRQIADNVTVLEQGRIIESGPTFDVFAFPQSKTARSFLSSIVAHELPKEVTDKLQLKPSGETDPVIRITFTGQSAHAPVIADLVERFHIKPNILHGRIDYIGGSALGILTIVAEGASNRLTELQAYLTSIGLYGEVIGHAIRPAVASAYRASY